MSEITVAAHARNLLGEVPVWCDRTSRLWWIDVMQSTLHNLDPTTGAITTLTTSGGQLGSIALCEEGGLLLATAEGIDRFDQATGVQQAFTGRDRLARRQRFNDGRCDRQGRFWVGSMNEDFVPDASLYRVDADGTLTECATDIIVTNGIAFAPDGRKFYFADTRKFTIWSFDFEPATGALSNRKVFAQTIGRTGRPDGACCDREGFLWSAEYAGGQIVRYAPDGGIDRVVALPVSHPTSVCFGGPELDTLFITSGRHTLSAEQAEQEPLAGAVLTLKPGVRGFAEPRFRG